MIDEYFLVEREGDFNIVSFKYKLLLPDIFSDEDKFTQCGTIASEMNANGIYEITITLFSNFDDLSEGETYTEKDIVESIKNLVASDIGVSFERDNFQIRRQIAA